MTWVNPLKARQAEKRAQAIADGTSAGELAQKAKSEPPAQLAHYQAALLNDINQLKQLRDVADKATLKAKLIPAYLPFIQDYIDRGDNYPNSVAVQVMIWLFDAGDILKGVSLALHLIRQGIHHTPREFGRNLETFVCDSVYDWAGALLKAEQSAEPVLSTTVAEMESGEWHKVMPQVVTGKMYAMLAKHKKLAGEFDTALLLCRKAEAANPDKAGVKNLIEELERKLKAQSAGEQGSAALSE